MKNKKSEISYLIGFVLICLSIQTAFAAQSGRLKNRSQPVLWSGTLEQTDPPLGEIPACAAAPCYRFDLTVSLPSDVWNNKPGGVEVAVRWTGFVAPNDAVLSDNLFLYVYRNGALVAKSDGIISTAQSLSIPNAANGLYQVYVVYDTTSPNETIPFEAMAEVEYPPNASPLRQLLPDLAVEPQRNVTFQTPPPIFFDLPPAPGQNCFPSEIEEEGAQRCLRFDQVFANIGEGALEMRFVIPHDQNATSRNVFQRIYRSDGVISERLAGEWEFHQAHQHYHFEGFALSRLLKANANGQPLSSVPVKQRRFKLNGKRHQTMFPVAGTNKVSFCIADIEIFLWAQKGNGLRTYNAPDCLFPAYSDAANDYLIQGITAGWADVYEWYLPDQYIEVSGVPDGYYILETIADPDNRMLEASENNNRGAVLIRLWDTGTSAPQAEIIRAL
jgi:hypothetical protein